MKTIEVEIAGESSLLMHSADAMLKQETITSRKKKYDNEVEAEKVAYRNKKKELIVPARCIKACLVASAGLFKIKGKSSRPIVAGCTRIEPAEIVVLNKYNKVLKDYEIDLRTVVVQQSRIVRARPRLDDWKLKFNIVYNDDVIGDVDILKKVLVEAGQRIGLLDNRPQKYGEHGCFKLTKFKA